MKALLAVACLAGSAFTHLAAQTKSTVVPAGTTISVRLTTAVSSDQSQPGQKVQAVVIAPVILNSQIVLPSHAIAGGAVEKAERKSSLDGRAQLKLEFREIVISQKAFQMKSRVTTVDNARETVQADGTILSLAPVHVKPSRVEEILMLAAYDYPLLLAAYEATKFALNEWDHPEVRYGKGVELLLVLLEDLRLESPSLEKPPDVLSAADQAAISALLTALPNRTHAEHPPSPSDWINTAFIGSRDQLVNSFELAGWMTADKLSLRSDVETFLAVADRHSYRHGPLSILLLNGLPPDLVFQKQTNTFAKRHHIRLWRTARTWQGRPLWLGAGTHDIGIDFSSEAKTFTHKIDGNVDLEREKVVNDLLFTGTVGQSALLPRKGIPAMSQNATGDRVTTDGKLAVLVLHP